MLVSLSANVKMQSTVLKSDSCSAEYLDAAMAEITYTLSYMSQPFFA